MAGLMSRFTTLFKVKANTMLDKAEDPGQTLDYSYQQQLEMLQKVKRGVADVVTAKKRLQLQTAKLEESVVKLDGQARQALAGNREDLARTALERKALIQGQLQGLDTQISALEQQQQNLVDRIGHRPVGSRCAKLFGRSIANDARSRPADVRFDQQGIGNLLCGGDEIACAVHDAGLGNGVTERRDERELPCLRGIDGEDIGAVEHGGAALLPMVEQRLGVEDWVLRLTKEARLRHPAEDQRRRDIPVRGIEAMIRKLNRQIGQTAPFQRREQGLKPLRVLVEDS